MKYFKRKDCRYCGSKDLEIFCELGKHAPSNSFITREEIKNEERFSLNLSLCKSCFLVQLQDVVPGNVIFKDYHYLSSSSKALVNHFKEMASKIVSKFNLKSNDLVVDIGCNDGILLDAYENRDLNLLGIEPSSVSQIALEKGYNIKKTFFNESVTDEIISEFGKAKIITATNVFAHVDDMQSITKSVTKLLDKNGVFIIEVSYLVDLIDNNLFDTIYHEHLCYLSLTPLVSFLKKFNLEVFDVEKNAVGASGPSVTFFIKKEESDIKVEYSVEEMLIAENQWGIRDIKTYKNFNKRVNKLKIDTRELIVKLQENGKSVGGFGAPAKGNTLLNFYGLNSDFIECIADNTEIKQGKVTPSSHIPIISDDEFLELNFDYALLLSWNYKKFFLENTEFIKKGGKFIVPFPFPHIEPN